MAELAGKTGALYYSTGTIRGITISAGSAANAFLDSDSGFSAAGFVAGDKIVSSGFTTGANNALFTISGGGVAAGQIDCDGTAIEDEAAGDIVTIVTAPDDAQLLGFYNWTINHTFNLEETTDFDDDTAKTYTPTVSEWTATAEQFWMTNQLLDAWMATQKWVRFFVRWNTAPNLVNAYYYEGMCTVSGVSTDTPVGDVVKQTLNFQGDGALTLVTRTTAWDT